MTTRTLPLDEPAASGRVVCDCLYFVVDAARPAGGARFPLAGVDQVSIGRGPRARAERDGRRLRIERPDPWMSGEHARLERDVAHWVISDEGARNGVVIGGRRQERALLLDGDLIELGRSCFALARAQPCGGDVVEVDRSAGGELATLDPGLAGRLAELRRIAASLAPVLISGPTGSGKERLARAVHAWSERGGAFVAVNCGALPAGLVESELFGHRRGAFSGAVEQHAGLIAASSGGTLFLDEIGDLPLAAQPALLRVLEEREVRAVGATRAEPVDLRIVAATHRDLDAEVEAGRFRDDLLARLRGFALELPPLAHRRVDLGLMLAELLPPGTGLTTAAVRALWSHDWPRNARELARAMERAAALAAGADVGAEHLPPELAADARDTAVRAIRPAEAERRERLIELLTEHRGNVTRVAAELGKVRSQVQRWLARYGLDPARYRG
jgi:DNA-binding NtrC family response regulator